MAERTGLSYENAIKIMYYFMALNGKMDSDKVDKFKEIGIQIDKTSWSYRDRIISECENQIHKAIDPEDYYDAIQEGISSAILNNSSYDNRASSKVIIWNMFAIAFDDGIYTEDERKLIKFVVRHLDLDKSDFLEIENAFKTINSIEIEINYLKTSVTKSFSEIENHINELQDRKNFVLGSAKDLLAM